MKHATLTFRDACGVRGCTSVVGEWTSIVSRNHEDSILWTCEKGHRTIVNGDLTIVTGPDAMIQDVLWEEREVTPLPPTDTGKTAMDQWLMKRPVKRYM